MTATLAIAKTPAARIRRLQTMLADASGPVAETIQTFIQAEQSAAKPARKPEPVAEPASRPEYEHPEIVRGVVTIRRPRPEPVAQAAPVAAEPRCRKPAPVAAESAAPAAPKAKPSPDRVNFALAGSECVAVRHADGWGLIIDGRPGAKRYATADAAASAAAVYLGGRVAAPVAAPAVPPPAAEPWRDESPTEKQVRLLARLRLCAAASGITYATPKKVTRGVASDLIDQLRAEVEKQDDAGESCRVGPFARGCCTVCGRKRAYGV